MSPEKQETETKLISSLIGLKKEMVKMKKFKLLIIILLLNSYIICSPVFARPGEPMDKVLKRYGVEGIRPFTQDDYISYKVNSSGFVSQPTLFLKVGAKGVILEQNFLFDKNTVHERDVQKAKNDSKPVVAIPHHAYLVGDFSQLPRESFDTKSKIIGAFAAPFGAAIGTIAGGGVGIYEGTKVGVKTADSASKALGGDVSGKAAGFASSATAVATGAITGLFAGFTGGAVEGSVRGARVGIEGLGGADMKITEAVPVSSNYVVIGGRIGKDLSPEEQKDLLNNLAKLEQSRLASESLGKGQEAAEAPTPTEDKTDTSLSDLDTAEDRSGFEASSNYLPEDSQFKNVAGMW